MSVLLQHYACYVVMCATMYQLLLHTMHNNITYQYPIVSSSVTRYTCITEHKEGFKQWRKKHYDEYRNIQRARMLLSAEQDEDDDDEDETMDNVS